jgi:two-component system, LytTR family, response regulator LytT
MTVAIIEDEPLTAKDLAACILAASPDAKVVATLRSVREAITFFIGPQPAPDIIFSDIQLGDGLSFSVFKAMPYTVPVIFCTAYDEYALKAFEAAGIDYILKPFTTKSIGLALQKFNWLRSRLAGMRESLAELGGHFGDMGQQSVLVHHGDKIIPVKVADIAVFYVARESTRLLLYNQQEFTLPKSLEELEKLVAGSFYRANRQYLVNREAIRDATPYFARKLLINLRIPFTEKITVPKTRAKHFLQWLEGE